MANKEHWEPGEIIQALRETGGNLTRAATKLGMSRRTIVYYCSRYDDVKAARDEFRQELVDEAEDGIAFHVRDRNLTACIYVLNTQGRDRGWGNHFQANLSGNISIEVQLPKPMQQQYPADTQNARQIQQDAAALLPPVSNNTNSANNSNGHKPSRKQTNLSNLPPNADPERYSK